MDREFKLEEEIGGEWEIIGWTVKVGQENQLDEKRGLELEEELDE